MSSNAQLAGSLRRSETCGPSPQHQTMTIRRLSSARAAILAPLALVAGALSAQRAPSAAAAVTLPRKTARTHTFTATKGT